MSTPPWQFWLSLGVALMASILPLPYDYAVWNPDWVALVVICWALHYPRRVGVGAAWVGGLLLDGDDDYVSIDSIAPMMTNNNFS